MLKSGHISLHSIKTINVSKILYTAPQTYTLESIWQKHFFLDYTGFLPETNFLHLTQTAFFPIFSTERNYLYNKCTLALTGFGFERMQLVHI